jgi:hypothetical protein
MSDVPELSSPRVAVVMSDGSTHEVQTLNPDLLRYDMTRSKHGWAPAQQAPMLWLTFIAWAALRREQLIPDDMGWELFSTERCISVQPLDEEGQPRTVDPTQVAAEPDSLLS